MKTRLSLLVLLIALLVAIACGTTTPNLEATQVAQDKATMEALATIIARQQETQRTPVPTDTSEPMGITITGEITNLEEAVDHLADDSYLQLVFLPPNGQLGGGTDEKGRVFYTSELSRIPIPSNGMFTFRAESLDPGSYLVAAQLLNNSFGMMSLLVKGEEYVTAEIPQNSELPLTIDVGEVTIPLPGP